MKYTTALLLAEAVAAARFTEQRRARSMERALARSSQPKIIAEGVDANVTQAQYSTNWAGAVVTTTGVSEVTGRFTVPSVSAGTGSGQSCASAWVGIDGDTCSTAILQTGIDFCYESGSATFDAWYEWYPDYAYDFDLTISEGDSILLTVKSTSDTAGTATIENETTGKSVSKSFSGDVQGDLCGYDAEWIVEDFEENGSLVSFVDFGTVTFTDATGVANGDTIDPSSGTILDIKQSSTVLTSCSASSDEVSCSYV